MSLFPNLHTIELLLHIPYYSEEVGTSAFKGFTYPKVHSVTVSMTAHGLLLSCPNVRVVRLSLAHVSDHFFRSFANSPLIEELHWTLPLKVLSSTYSPTSNGSMYLT